ncbi:hypothetical protein BC832DRAFT_589245 [Gaertneriomyces semiglobifer]|nr:hypothetical protein BC832DRAFT_589245 [Gaertneriomyces semiglobifer]
MSRLMEFFAVRQSSAGSAGGRTAQPRSRQQQPHGDGGREANVNINHNKFSAKHQKRGRPSSNITNDNFQPTAILKNPQRNPDANIIPAPDTVVPPPLRKSHTAPAKSAEKSSPMFASDMLDSPPDTSNQKERKDAKDSNNNEKKRRNKKPSSERQQQQPVLEQSEPLKPAAEPTRLQQQQQHQQPQRKSSARRGTPKQRRLSAPDLRLQQPLLTPASGNIQGVADYHNTNNNMSATTTMTTLNATLYAGATFQNSPAASALPVPVFSNRSLTKSAPPMQTSPTNITESTSLPTPVMNSQTRHPPRTYSHEALNVVHTPSPCRSTRHGNRFHDDSVFAMDDDHHSARLNDDDLRKKSRDLLSLLKNQAVVVPHPSPSHTGVPHPHEEDVNVLNQISLDLKSMLNIGGGPRVGMGMGNSFVGGF